jgi:hypothetical protein
VIPVRREFGERLACKESKASKATRAIGDSPDYRVRQEFKEYQDLPARSVPSALPARRAIRGRREFLAR